MRCVENWVEVAPSLLICPARSSNCPKLETILEEGSEGLDDLKTRVVVVLFLLPVLVSLVSFLLLYRNGV